MTSKLGRLVCFVGFCLVLAIGGLPQTASALDTANVLMNIDGMVISHQGLFRNFEPNDGAQTFSYGVFQTGPGSQGRYKSFFLVVPGGVADIDACCISHRIRLESWGPETFQDEGATPGYPDDVYGVVTGDFTDAYYPVIDRAGFGTLIDASEYQLKVKFKPVFGLSGSGVPDNAAEEARASIDRHYGFSFNAEKQMYERSMEQIQYTIGVSSEGDYNQDGVINTADRDVVDAHKGQTFQLPNENPNALTPGVVDTEDLRFWEDRNGRVVTPINTWYASAPKDANGFATWTVPLTDNVNSHRTTNILYGDDVFRDQNTVTGGGRVQNPNSFPVANEWEDVPVGFGGPLFGGGPEDPARPGSRLNTPNGINLLYFGKDNRRQAPLSLEVLSVSIEKINPGPIAARIDEYSGISARFGSGFTRGPDFAPINVPGDGIPYLPRATDQISRFDENGLTNLIFNMRTPDPPATPETPPETHRFLLRYGPNANTFDSTGAMVNVRARLTAPMGAGIAPTLTLVAKDLDGNDQAALQGADEYTFNLALSQFNTSTFTTVSIPLSSFNLSTHVPRTDTVFGSGPGGFTNAGDGSRTEFNLYEFGGLIAPNTGLLKLELDYMEIRLPELTLIGDYNNNGKVDAADYTVWRDNLGGAGSLLGTNRDPAQGATPISIADYNSWKAHFGQGGPGSGGAVSGVPEPATISLVAWLLVVVANRRRTR